MWAGCGESNAKPLPRHRCRAPALARACLAALWALSVLASRAHATSLTVPDDVSSIQAALDAAVDTVLVRPGSYSETPVVRRQVYLAGLFASGHLLPSLTGLRLLPAVDYSSGIPTLSFRNLDCVQTVTMHNDDEQCFVVFTD